jgi:hypothetical protein
MYTFARGTSTTTALLHISLLLLLLIDRSCSTPSVISFNSV